MQNCNGIFKLPFSSFPFVSHTSASITFMQWQRVASLHVAQTGCIKLPGQATDSSMVTYELTQLAQHLASTSISASQLGYRLACSLSTAKHFLVSSNKFIKLPMKTLPQTASQQCAKALLHCQLFLPRFADITTATAVGVLCSHSPQQSLPPCHVPLLGFAKAPICSTPL